MGDKPTEYKKLLIDNAVCKRRFHLIYESGAAREYQVQVYCPHCNVTLFSKQNHPPVTLAREENLVKSPDGSEAIIYECKFATVTAAKNTSPKSKRPDPAGKLVKPRNDKP